MFDLLTHHVSDNPVTYLVALAAAGGDVLVPLIPAEAIVISAGIVAARGGLEIAVLIAAVACGALLGDNLAYLLGARAGEPAARRLFRGEHGRRRLRAAERAVRRHGGALIVIGRFLPGGRTASTFAAGTLEMPWRRFLAADAVAALAWAAYASSLGYLGGAAFGHGFWRPLVVAFAVGSTVGLAAEAWRRVQRGRGRDILGEELAERRRGRLPGEAA